MYTKIFPVCKNVFPEGSWLLAIMFADYSIFLAHFQRHNITNFVQFVRRLKSSCYTMQRIFIAGKMSYKIMVPYLSLETSSNSHSSV